MKVCVLSSGSKGNSTLVITDKVKILIDLGTTTSYVEAALNNLNVDVKEISHILITHSHVDHIKGLKVFIKRFFTQQFKRSCMPDGVKVGSISLSPRGDLRMPSDASYNIWIKELEEI